MSSDSRIENQSCAGYLINIVVLLFKQLSLEKAYRNNRGEPTASGEEGYRPSTQKRGKFFGLKDWRWRDSNSRP